jgi:hypothetical protein
MVNNLRVRKIGFLIAKKPSSNLRESFKKDTQYKSFAARGRGHGG